MTAILGSGFSSARSRRFLPFAVVIALLLSLLYYSSDSAAASTVKTHIPSWKSSSSASSKPLGPITLDPSCANLPGTSETLLVMKTGSSVLEKRLPIHFTTTFRCTPDFLVFSDMEQEFNGIQIHDSLDELYKYVDMSNPDLAYYEYLKKTGGRKVNAKSFNWFGFSKDVEEPQFQAKESDAAWEMDKYKNIPILRKSYAMYPDKKWYLFVDADTSVMWNNAMTWIQQLNSSKPFYTGSQNWIGDVEFAHGGSGYLVSQAAAKILAEEDEEKAKEHISFAEHECCGDMVLAHAFHDNGIALNGSWPNIQGSTPTTLDFHEWNWCYAAMTFHHTSPEMTEQLWKLDREMSGIKNITYGDIFTHIVQPQIPHEANEWDNGSEDMVYPPKRDRDSDEPIWEPNENEIMAMSSFEGCREACKEQWQCMQFIYKVGATSEGQPFNKWPGQCGLRKAVSFGQKSTEGLDMGYPGVRSGWDLQRIEEWQRHHACREAIYLTEWGLDGHYEPGQEY